MKAELAKPFYNAAGVTELNDPSSSKSVFAVERIRTYLESTVKTGMKTLDLGCGAGRFTFALEKLGAEAIGVDCSEVALDHARKVSELEQRNCTFQECVLPSIPFADNSFDLVLLADNIAEFSYEDVAELSGEVLRVLKVNGIFCLSFKPDELQHGLQVSEFTVPSKGKFEYHSYPWSVEKAKSVIGEYLPFVSADRALEETWWVTFKNSD